MKSIPRWYLWCNLVVLLILTVFWAGWYWLAGSIPAPFGHSRLWDLSAAFVWIYSFAMYFDRKFYPQQPELRENLVSGLVWFFVIGAFLAGQGLAKGSDFADSRLALVVLGFLCGWDPLERFFPASLALGLGFGLVGGLALGLAVTLLFGAAGALLV